MRTPVRAVPLLIAMVLSSAAMAQTKNDKAAKPPQVSRGIIKPLVAAQEASKKEQWAECVAKLKETEAVPNRTPYDLYVSNDILGFCALRAGDNPTAIQAWSQVLDSEFADPARSASLRKGLLQLSYQIKDYSKAVEYGRRLIADGSTDDPVPLSSERLQGFGETRCRVHRGSRTAGTDAPGHGAAVVHQFLHQAGGRLLYHPRARKAGEILPEERNLAQPDAAVVPIGR
jgi:hypothetical protein